MIDPYFETCIADYEEEQRLLRETAEKRKVRKNYWHAYEEESIRSSYNPEKACIYKDLFSKLSREARMVTRVIYDLPDEMFTATGRLITKQFNAYMKKRFNWSFKKTNEVQKEIADLFC